VIDFDFPIKRDHEDRPIAFLVSTTPCARNIAEHLGSPAYSYHFVAEALAPVFRLLGEYRLIDHPESRLAFAARQAEKAGFRPVHIAINPLQDVYLSPALPNVVFPFWEFPDIPDRDFGFDTRQNWVRICRRAALVLTACRFTASAFEKAGVDVPVGVVPIPVPPGAFDLPDWDPDHLWTLDCRHEILGAEPPLSGPAPAAAHESAPSSEPVGETSAATIRTRSWQAVRRGFRRIAPWLSPRTVAGLMMLKRALVSNRDKDSDSGPSAFELARRCYRQHVQRWLSPYALAKVTRAQRRLLALTGREPRDVADPPLPSGPLALGGGLVYLTMINFGDERKNYTDILSAFILAFRDRPDVTLVVKLTTNRLREHHEVGLFRASYRAMGLTHRCRIVVLTEFLNEEQLNALYRATTYYVNASFAEGACLPLMRALAGGRPAIAPDHTAMADYIDDAVGFVLRSHAEPIHWPHDPEKRLETTRRRVVWSDLHDAFLASAEAAASPARYAVMAAVARVRMDAHASQYAVAEALRGALEQLPPEKQNPVPTGRSTATA
jgi:glycosyltransferase involved in cell wall biosynthesis